MPLSTGKRRPSSTTILGLIGIPLVLFLAIKLPMCFVPRHWEELRDYDAFVRAAHSETPYQDYYWQYGPLAPFVHGMVLKVMPETLLTTRIVTLLLWCVGVSYLAMIFSLFFSSRKEQIIGVLLASAIFGYPSHSQSHAFAAVGALVSLFYLLKFGTSKRQFDLVLSAVGVSVVLFSRPVLAGYLLSGGWFLSVAILYGRKALWRAIPTFLLVAMCVLGFFIGVYGPGILLAFLPRSSAVYSPLPYPNIHYIADWYKHPTPMAIKGAFDTLIFYLNFFLWPAAIVTLSFVHEKDRFVRGSLIASICSLAISCDVLHYGYSDPVSESRTLNRAQHFFSLSMISLFLILWPTIKRQSGLKRWGSIGLLSLVGAWAMIPWGEGIYRELRATKNYFGFPDVDALRVDRDERAFYEAAAFIRKNSRAEDRVLVAFYYPGLKYLFGRDEILERDVHLFEYLPNTEIRAGQSPYARESSKTIEQIVADEVKRQHPRFIVSQRSDEPLCREKNQREFLSEKRRVVVCWTDVKE